MSDKYVKCDGYLNSSDPNIFAAGDIVSYPSIQNAERLSFAHYVAAQQQGSIAALNMLDKVLDTNIESTL
jgi:NADPH-dependent 2,4-dienoyl-CoA reductase/sulfur reductase-like enzyme